MMSWGDILGSIIGGAAVGGMNGRWMSMVDDDHVDVEELNNTVRNDLARGGHTSASIQLYLDNLKQQMDTFAQFNDRASHRRAYFVQQAIIAAAEELGIS